MGVRGWLCAVWLLAALPAAAAESEELAPGVHVLDRGEAGQVVAVASAAADLHAPNVEVARVKAERQARERATARLRAALLALPAARWSGAPPTAETLAPVLQQAAAEPEYESDGSVVLRLRLPLLALPAKLLAPGHEHHGEKHRKEAR